MGRLRKRELKRLNDRLVTSTIQVFRGKLLRCHRGRDYAGYSQCIQQLCGWWASLAPTEQPSPWEIFDLIGETNRVLAAHMEREFEFWLMSDEPDRARERRSV